jgi:hypothetical protein
MRIPNTPAHDTLDGYGVDSIAKAAEVMAHRSELQSKVASARVALEELDADALAQALSDAEEELTAAEADVARRMEQVADAEQPVGLAEARAWRDREDDFFKVVESEETSAKSDAR